MAKATPWMTQFQITKQLLVIMYDGIECKFDIARTSQDKHLCILNCVFCLFCQYTADSFSTADTLGQKRQGNPVIL